MAIQLMHKVGNKVLSAWVSEQYNQLNGCCYGATNAVSTDRASRYQYWVFSGIKDEFSLRVNGSKAYIKSGMISVCGRAVIQDEEIEVLDASNYYQDTFFSLYLLLDYSTPNRAKAYYKTFASRGDYYYAGQGSDLRKSSAGVAYCLMGIFDYDASEHTLSIKNCFVPKMKPGHRGVTKRVINKINGVNITGPLNQGIGNFVTGGNVRFAEHALATDFTTGLGGHKIYNAGNEYGGLSHWGKAYRLASTTDLHIPEPRESWRSRPNQNYQIHIRKTLDPFIPLENLESIRFEWIAGDMVSSGETSSDASISGMNLNIKYNVCLWEYEPNAQMYHVYTNYDFCNIYLSGLGNTFHLNLDDVYNKSTLTLNNYLVTHYKTFKYGDPNYAYWTSYYNLADGFPFCMNREQQRNANLSYNVQPMVELANSNAAQEHYAQIDVQTGFINVSDSDIKEYFNYEGNSYKLDPFPTLYNWQGRYYIANSFGIDNGLKIAPIHKLFTITFTITNGYISAYDLSTGIQDLSAINNLPVPFATDSNGSIIYLAEGACIVNKQIIGNYTGDMFLTMQPRYHTI